VSGGDGERYSLLVIRYSVETNNVAATAAQQTMVGESILDLIHASRRMRVNLRP
jgi:hypothetical protein